MKKTTKVFISSFLANSIENLILLAIFGVAISKGSILGAVVFSIFLTLILKGLKVIR